MSDSRETSTQEDVSKHKKTSSLLQIPEGNSTSKNWALSTSKSSDANLSGSDSSRLQTTNEIPTSKSYSSSSRLSPMSMTKTASGDSSDERDQQRPERNSTGSRESSFERSVSFQENSQESSKKDAFQASDSNRSFDQDSIPTNNSKPSQRDKKDSKGDKEGKGEKEKKRSKPWYNMINPDYKTRSEYLKRLFDLPSEERLIVDYSCALQKEILVHGRLYVTQNYFFFYSKIFGWETFLSIKCKDIVSMTKGKTALVIPNALQINTETDKHFLTSFAARDKTYLMLFRIWQNALVGQQMSLPELWQWVHISYGDELGLTSDDDDYIAPSADEDFRHLGAPNDSGEKGLLLSRANSAEDGNHSANNASRPPSSLGKKNGKKSPKKFSSPVPTPDPKEPDEIEPDLPTDLSDSCESDVELEQIMGNVQENLCPNICSHHVGREALNTVYPLPIDTLFTLLFTNSKFMLDLHTSRKTTDVDASDWQANDDTNQRIRQVTYTLTLPTNSLGPKVSHVTETQVMASFSTPGEIYTIDVEASNRGIPYADSFFVSTHWCLTKVSFKETRLSVWCEVKYKKSVFSFMKSVIDKNAYSGVDGLMSDLNTALLLEIDSLERKGRQARRQRAGSKSGVELALGRSHDFRAQAVSRQHASNKIGGASMKPRSEAQPSNSPSFFMMLMLGLLVFLTGFLCYRLTVLEDKLTRMSFEHKYFDPNVFKLASNSNPELLEQWIKILQHQEHLHALETQAWHQKLQDAASHLHQAEKSLRNLQVDVPARQANKIQALLLHFRQLTDQKDSSEVPLQSTASSNNLEL